MIQHVYGEKKGKQMIKLIATDIDGTLVADGTLDLNPEYYDVIKELKRRGTIVLAASGRQFYFRKWNLYSFQRLSICRCDRPRDRKNLY